MGWENENLWFSPRETDPWISANRAMSFVHRVSKCHSGQATVQTVVTSALSNGGRISDAGEGLDGRVTGGAASTAVANSGGEDGRKNYPRNMQHTKATKHVVNMLVAVVVAFFICWAPFHAQRLLAVHGHSVITPDIIVLYTILTYISGVLYYLSTCINPFLYHIMSNKFRNAFRETLSRYMPVGGRARTPARRYSTLSLPRSVSPTRSQSLSNSGGTSRQASLRYVDADMSRRPLVVSFRRPNNSLPMTCIHAAHCSCSRNGDHRRNIYSNRIKETPMSEEAPTMYSLAPPKIKRFKKWSRRKHDTNMYNSDPNNMSCKIICSECHKYLNNKETHCEREHKVVVITRSLSRVLSETPTFIDDNLIISNNSDSIDEKSSNLCSDADAMEGEESDLIPHHQCPNRHDKIKVDRISNSSLCSNNLCVDNLSKKKNTKSSQLVPQSKTMPDIVKYVLQIQESSGKTVFRPHNGVTERVVKFNNVVEDRSTGKVANGKIDTVNRFRNTKRKWGSAENLFFEIR